MDKIEFRNSVQFQLKQPLSTMLSCMADQGIGQSPSEKAKLILGEWVSRIKKQKVIVKIEGRSFFREKVTICRKIIYHLLLNFNFREKVKLILIKWK